MKILGITLLSVFLFFSCSNSKDYVYNEVTASEYKSLSDNFEKIYEKLKSGSIPTTFEIKNEIDLKTLNNDIQYLREAANNAKTKIGELERSSDTDEFNELIVSYFDAVSGPFTDEFEAYVKIDCDCPAQKDSIIKIIEDEYKKISAIEDEALEKQKIMFEKTGMKAK